MKIIIRNYVKSEQDNSARTFFVKNDAMFNRVKGYLANLNNIRDYLMRNIGTEKNSNSFWFKLSNPNTIPMLTAMTKGLLLARSSIDYLDYAAEQAGLTVPQLQSFKESLEGLQKYYDDILTDVYTQTSRADLPDTPPDEPHDETPDGGKNAKESDSEKVVLEITGLDKLNLDAATQEKFEEGFTNLLNQIFSA